MRPVLQIIHISDVHRFTPDPLVSKGLAAGLQEFADSYARFAHRIFRCLPPNLLGRSANDMVNEFVRDGFGQADRSALRDFESKLAEICGPGSQWPEDVPTWLVDTGDVSTWGDPDSIQAHLDWLRDLAQRYRLSVKVKLHGNHDYWPCWFPLNATSAAIDDQRKWLRSRPYGGLHSSLAASLIIDDGVAIDLYTFSSPVWQKYLNTLAVGRIYQDEVFGDAADARYQVQHAHRAIAARRADGLASVRIACSHHPLASACYTTRYLPVMRMPASRNVARALTPDIKLFLSGHTHGYFPDGRRCSMDPLNEGLQFVVGSLAKTDARDAAIVEADPESWHQFQTLRFFADPSAPTSIVLQREVFSRRENYQPFAACLSDRYPIQAS